MAHNVKLIWWNTFENYFEIKSDKYPNIKYFAALWDSQSDLTDDGQYDPVFFLTNERNGLSNEEGIKLQQVMQEDKELLLELSQAAIDDDELIKYLKNNLNNPDPQIQRIVNYINDVIQRMRDLGLQVRS